MGIIEFYKNKTVLVTGGAGSIGTALVRTLLEFNPQNVVLIDNNEGAIYDLEQDLRSSRLSTFIADIRDKERLNHSSKALTLFFTSQRLRIFQFVSSILMKLSKRTSWEQKTSLMPAYARMLKR
jgi:UDP-N-acetylglucosamine 4,6-dehydratase/5-epimerase